MPILFILAATVANRHLRRLTPWVIVVAIAYAVPLGVWLLRPDPASGLSKDIHPALAGVLIAAALGYAAAGHFIRRRKLVIVWSSNSR
ncbi:hypothetical protein [Renibacterium salmoninarum]|uniref:hypothetical protein n=1 Tax=Renibacterium salmoninarum TaxID=1646 RepID=UPI000673E7B3|nr:hypothetical protein [Renibacterium salmoninarum]